jgi:hypothetical protein
VVDCAICYCAGYGVGFGDAAKYGIISNKNQRAASIRLAAFFIGRQARRGEPKRDISLKARVGGIRSQIRGVLCEGTVELLLENYFFQNIFS